MPAIMPASSTGAAPLTASSRYTNTPHFHPSARETLVAPMFPLPTVRKFTPFMRATIGPNGMLPHPKATSAAIDQCAGVNASIDASASVNMGAMLDNY